MAVKNPHGRIYVPGKPRSDQFRGEFLKMFNRGFSKMQMSRDLQVAPRTVRKIIRHFQRYVTLSAFSHGGSEPHEERMMFCFKTNTAIRFHIQIINPFLHS